MKLYYFGEKSILPDSITVNPHNKSIHMIPYNHLKRKGSEHDDMDDDEFMVNYFNLKIGLDFLLRQISAVFKQVQNLQSIVTAKESCIALGTAKKGRCSTKNR